MNLRLALLLPLAACSPAAPPPERPPLEGAAIGGPFALVDQRSARRTDADFAGRWRVMYFGYTFCPDVCPVDVQHLAAGLKAFERDDPARGATVVPIFVTIDPARDTPEVVGRFAAAFHPRMVGLTGSADAVAAVAKRYGVFYARGKGTAGGYLMDHSRQAYLMDPVGKPVTLVPVDETPAAVVATLARWVR